MKKPSGYVYILTNPCFQEDCVKIGKTKRNPEDRKKELSGKTETPLPFEVYAFAKTTQYKELEEAMHRGLEMAGKRINPKREFFRILPDDALKYLEVFASVDEKAEIEAPENELTKGRKYTINSSKAHDAIFKYRNTRDGAINAKLKIVDGKFVVLKGSKIYPGIISNHESARAHRKRCEDSIKNDTVIEDIVFDFPSGAGQFVSGGSSNGKVEWIDEKTGEPLGNFLIYS